MDSMPEKQDPERETLDQFEDAGYQNPEETEDLDEVFASSEPEDDDIIEAADSELPEDFEKAVDTALVVNQETWADPETGEPKRPASMREGAVFDELVDVVGYDADNEGILMYPVALVGDVRISVDDDVTVSYQLRKDFIGKQRSPSVAEDVSTTELGHILTPTEYTSFEIDEDGEYLNVDFQYSPDELQEGSREVGRSLEEVEDYLSARI